MAFMRDEIGEQPEILRRLPGLAADAVRALATACRAREKSGDLTGVVIAARGTSDHAAVFARYFIEYATAIPTGLAAPSLFTLYRRPPRLGRVLTLAISQSGEAEDAIEVLRQAREQQGLTACIVNHAHSTMARVAEHVLLCHAGEERSVPATKTYTASLALAYLLAAEMAARDDLREQLARVPESVEAVLAGESTIAAAARACAGVRTCVVLARGLNYATALETALKLAETCYLRAQGFSAADFLHGPIASVDPADLCLIYAPSGAAYPAVLALLPRLRERNARLAVFSDRDEALAFADLPVRLPAVPEEVSPLVAIVAGQLFTYHLAIASGHDPDRPRGLQKVTRTR